MGFTLGQKFNENTDWEFRISNETIAQVVAGTGISESDIADYCYSAFIDKRITSVIPESTRNSNDGLYPWAQECCPVYNTNQGQHPSKLKMNVDVLEDNKVECYERNILVYYGTVNGVTGHYLVMDIHDIKKWIIDCDGSGAFGSMSVTSTADFNGINGTIYTYDTNNVPIISPKDAPAGTTGNLSPCNIVNIDSTLWVGFFTPIAHSKNLICNEKLSHAAWEFDYAAGDTFNVGATGYVYQGDATTLQGWCEFSDLEFPLSQGPTTTFTTYIDADGFNIIKISGQYGNNNNPFVTNCEIGNMFTTIKALHTVESWAGFLFYDNGVTYKPIIEGGIVVGFTSDMDIPSEWDNMTNVTGNHISPTPPTPPTPDNPFDVDAETYGWGGNEVGGMVRYYLLSKAEMDNLQTAMASNANWTIDYLNCVVSCFIVPNNGIFFNASIVSTVKFHLDNATQWDTGVSCHRITGVNNVSGGTIEIPAVTGTFLDKEPYADYSIYIPFCGRIPIKGNIVCGREITVTYYPDVPTCSLTAVVTCGGSTIAITRGTFGSQIPVTSNGSDRKTASVIGNVAPIITGIGLGIAGIATGGIGLAIAGGSAVVGGLLNSAKDSVQSYGYSTGSSGDSSFFGAGTRCQYYANYMQLDSVVDNSTFGHTVGYLCNEVGTLNNFHGFTVVSNPHIKISATSTEKEEIKQLLEQGVILP